MPTARALPATAVVDDKIYVISGYSGIDRHLVNIKASTAVEVYNRRTDTWERKKDMRLPRYQLGVGVVAGKIYAIGGYVLPQNIKPGAPWRIDLVEVYTLPPIRGQSAQRCRRNAMGLVWALSTITFMRSVDVGGR